MSLRQPKRRGAGAKRMDTSDLEVLIQRLIGNYKWVAIAKVIVPEGEAKHWRTVEKDGKVVDVLVDVETQPGLLDITCRLGCDAGALGGGLWRVPPVGAEVIVCMPDGELEHNPTIVKVCSSRDVPARVSDERTILVASDVIEVTAPMVVVGADPDSNHPAGRGDNIKARLNRLENAFDIHVHLETSLSTNAPTAVPGVIPVGQTTDDVLSPSVRVG